MHKDDQMTPLERGEAFAKGDSIDRVPIMPFTGTVCAQLVNMSLREMLSSTQHMADAQLKAYDRWGSDCLIVDYGLHGIGIALGSKTNAPEHGVPALTEFVLKDLNHLETLDLSKLALNNNKELQFYVEMAEKLLDKKGHECSVDITIPGPLTAAASIYQTEFLLRSIRSNPEGLRKLLRITTQAIKDLVAVFAKLGVSFTLCDPVASGTMLRANQYQSFVFDHTKEIVDFIHENNSEVCYHICGDRKKILKEMVATGVDMLSLDNIVDMAYAKEQVGDKICLVGNVDPVGIIFAGTTSDIDEDVKTCFKKTYDSPNGFILATGCDIPPDTKLSHVDQFMASGRKYGKWPLEGNRYL